MPFECTKRKRCPNQEEAHKNAKRRKIDHKIKPDDPIIKNLFNTQK